MTLCSKFLGMSQVTTQVSETKISDALVTGHRVSELVEMVQWCNPAPLDGSAPNLVIAETDRQGHVVYKRAFNTQACEQLNAWIGGFEFILKKMTPGNFNWFLHTMLFYHTQYVINKQMKTDEEDEEDAESDDEI